MARGGRLEEQRLTSCIAIIFCARTHSALLQIVHATQLSPLIPNSPWIISGPSAALERAKEQLQQSGRLSSDTGGEGLAVLGEKTELVSGLRLMEDVMRVGNTALSWSVSRLALRIFGVFLGSLSFPHHLLPGVWSFLLFPYLSLQPQVC